MSGRNAISEMGRGFTGKGDKLRRLRCVPLSSIDSEIVGNFSSGSSTPPTAPFSTSLLVLFIRFSSEFLIFSRAVVNSFAL